MAIAAPMPWLAPVTSATACSCPPNAVEGWVDIALPCRAMDMCETFRLLHADGIFVMPNPWDVGSAKRLADLGFPALATTSSGFAWSIGKQDQQVKLDELLPHVEALVAAVDVPLNVDAERGYADTPEGVGRTVHLLGLAGAAGCSIEDYDPVAGAVDPLDVAVERVAAAAAAGAAHGIVLTAR